MKKNEPKEFAGEALGTSDAAYFIEDSDDWKYVQNPQIKGLEGALIVEVVGEAGNSYKLIQVHNGYPLADVVAVDIFLRPVGAIVANVVFSDKTKRSYQVLEIRHRDL